MQSLLDLSRFSAKVQSFNLKIGTSDLLNNNQTGSFLISNTFLIKEDIFTVQTKTIWVYVSFSFEEYDNINDKLDDLDAPRNYPIVT